MGDEQAASKASVAIEHKSMLDAGDVGPSSTKYVVTWPHGHRQLKMGDVVTVVETPGGKMNLLLRWSDGTLHETSDHHGQYVHLRKHEARVEGQEQVRNLGQDAERFG